MQKHKYFDQKWAIFVVFSVPFQHIFMSVVDYVKMFLVILSCVAKHKGHSSCRLLNVQKPKLTNRQPP